MDSHFILNQEYMKLFTQTTIIYIILVKYSLIREPKKATTQCKANTGDCK